MTAAQVNAIQAPRQRGAFLYIDTGNKFTKGVMHRKEAGLLKRNNSLFCSALLLLILLPAVLLASCGKSETNEASASESESDDGNPVIVMVEKYSTKPSEYLLAALSSLAKKYEEEGNREIKIVTVDPMADQVAEQEFDIAICDSTNWGTSVSPYSMMTEGKLADLTPYLANDIDYNSADYIEPVLNAGRIGDSRFLLPVQYSISVIAGDNTVSDKYDLPNSEDLLDCEAFWNKILNAGDEIPVFSSTSSYFSGDLNPSMTFITDGGTLYDVQNNEAMFDADYFINPLTLLSKYYKGSEITPYNYYKNPSVKAVTDEKGGLLYYNTGGAQTFLSCKVENMLQSESYFYGSVPYTEESAGKFSATVMTGLGISADSKRKDAAYDFLMYCYTSDELFTGQYNCELYFPVKKSLLISQCDKAITEAGLASGTDTLTEYGISADSLYDEVTNISYAHMQDVWVNSTITDSIGEEHADADTIIANLENNRSSLSGKYGIFK